MRDNRNTPPVPAPHPDKLPQVPFNVFVFTCAGCKKIRHYTNAGYGGGTEAMAKSNANAAGWIKLWGKWYCDACTKIDAEGRRRKKPFNQLPSYRRRRRVVKK